MENSYRSRIEENKYLKSTSCLYQKEVQRLL
jgi:hypothetical protein